MTRSLILPFALLLATTAGAQSGKAKTTTLHNPVIPGYYADPEARIFNNQYWLYPTFSDHSGTPDSSTGLSAHQRELQKNTINQQYLKQTWLDAFSSENLVDWKKYPHVLDIRDISWAAYSIWAPSITKKDNKYYLFFGANDIQNDQEEGGIGIAVSDKPSGPFKDYLGKPLINKFYHGAQPIDQMVFQDTDGQYYLIYGGWKHCNIGKLKDDFTGFIPFEDGELFHSITPDNYVEGPFMFIRKGKYYMMWSEGGWTGPDYSVAYAIGDSPLGPFKRIGKILQQDSTVATGAGHHSVINIPNTDDWYIVYHRRPLGDKNGHHRVTCIDRMVFDKNDQIEPVRITYEGVTPRWLKK